MRRGYPNELSRRTVLTGITSVALSQSRELSSNGKMVLPAKPGSFIFDPLKTAVIVVDMQNDFGAGGDCSTAKG